jgi:hypothetical protein
MRLLILLATLSSLGCVGIPPKPSVNLCLLDVPANEASCGRTGTNDPIQRVPLAAMDKATAFSPADWELIKNYIDEMEDYVRHRCAP